MSLSVPGSHPLLGQLARLTVEQIEESLKTFPPSRTTAAAIAWEELRGHDRPAVYRALALYVSPLTVAGAILSEPDP